MKTFVLSTDYYKRLVTYRDRISPDVTLPVFVYNITDKKIKLNLKFNSNYDYSGDSSCQHKEKWVATIRYDEENENSLTLLLLHTI